VVDVDFSRRDLPDLNTGLESDITAGGRREPLEPWFSGVVPRSPSTSAGAGSGRSPCARPTAPPGALRSGTPGARSPCGSRGNLRVYIPLGTCIVLSIVLTIPADVPRS